MTAGLPQTGGETVGFVPVPPDGGWGWMVVLGSFIIHVMADGITYSFGLLFDEIVEAFGESRFFAAWIPAILVGVTLGFGPFASAVTNRYGCRTATIIGSIIAAFGSAISFYATGVSYLMVSIGFIMGIGCGLMYCPAIVVVTMYFEKSRSFATGLAVCGAGLGTFIFSPLTDYLIDTYSWRGTFLIYAGFLLNGVICGALFRPLKMVPCYVTTLPDDEVEKELSLVKLNEISQIDSFPREKRSGMNSPAGMPSFVPSSGPKSAKSPLDNKRKINPIILPSIVETEDNEEDMAYALNPHRKTSEHFLCELSLTEDHLTVPLPERNAITPSASPPSTPEILNPKTYKGLPLPYPLAPVSGVDPKKLMRSISDQPVVAEENSALLNILPSDKEITVATDQQSPKSDNYDDAVNVAPTPASPKRLFSYSSLSSLFGKNQPVMSHKKAPNAAGRSFSFMPRNPSNGTLTGGKSLTITAHLARRQQLKQQAKAIEAKRRRIISEYPHRFLVRRDRFYSGSLYNIPFYKSNPDLYRTSLASIPQSLAAATVGVQGLHRQFSRRCSTMTDAGGITATDVNAILEELGALEKPLSCREKVLDLFSDVGDSFRQMTDFSLLKNHLFLLYTISNFLTSVGFNIPLVFLPGRAEKYHLSRNEASWVLSAFGIANTVGRVIIGFVSDRPWANRLLIYNISLTLCGLCTILSFLCRDFATLSLYAAIFGATISTYVSLTSVILVDFLGLDKLTSAFGLLLLWQGIASIVGPPIAGWIYDSTDDYDPAFYFAGISLAISGLMLYLVPLVREKKQLPTDYGKKASIEREALFLQKMNSIAADDEEIKPTRRLTVFIPTQIQDGAEKGMTGFVTDQRTLSMSSGFDQSSYHSSILTAPASPVSFDRSEDPNSVELTIDAPERLD